METVSVALKPSEGTYLQVAVWVAFSAFAERWRKGYTKNIMKDGQGSWLDLVIQMILKNFSIKPLVQISSTMIGMLNVYVKGFPLIWEVNQRFSVWKIWYIM